MFKWLKYLGNRGSSETTPTTMTECIPIALSTALLELEEGDIILPLVARYDFPGPGVIHRTPIISKLTAENDQSLSNQAIDSGTYTGSPSNATVEDMGATVFLKELAVLGSTDDLMAVAGQLIGSSIVAGRDTQLATLFTSITAIQGGANNDIVPADLFAAYKKLRIQTAPQVYNLVLNPGVIWGTVGLINMFAATADANHFPGSLGGGMGTVGEDFMRNGFSGRIFGFDLYADANVTVTSNNSSGAAFSRNAIKYVQKRPLRIDVLYNGPEVGWQVTGTEFFGSAILKNNFGVEMQFNSDT